MALKYTFKAPVWVYSGQSAWHFVTLPKDISSEIKEISASIPRAGFGSIRVKVTCKDQTWQTSVFPDSKTGCYFLPIKKAILKATNLDVDDIAQITIILTDV